MISRYLLHVKLLLTSTKEKYLKTMMAIDMIKSAKSTKPWMKILIIAITIVPKTKYEASV
jgi:hypothetical protein